ncbi:hypothetical protein [Nonomuraea fuscirosea]|uniref:hypothetical protein n=1 Tax=Nonomuraea fuscirosea TaxID=1291556 RepID=UPI00342FBF4C
MGSSYRSYKDADPAEVAGRHLEKASGRPYEVLRRRHLRDYQEPSGRVEIDLGTSEASHSRPASASPAGRTVCSAR